MRQALAHQARQTAFSTARRRLRPRPARFEEKKMKIEGKVNLTIFLMLGFGWKLKKGKEGCTCPAVGSSKTLSNKAKYEREKKRERVCVCVRMEFAFCPHSPTGFLADARKREEKPRQLIKSSCCNFGQFFKGDGEKCFSLKHTHTHTHTYVLLSVFHGDKDEKKIRTMIFFFFANLTAMIHSCTQDETKPRQTSIASQAQSENAFRLRIAAHPHSCGGKI